jgi:hypothetical protein
MSPALVVVDLQNDFCTGSAVARYSHLDSGRLAEVAAGAARAVDSARDAGVEVVFVRFVGDVEHQGPSWRARDAALGKRPKCLEGTPGAAFYGVSPRPGERVFTKRACFDAFLADGFEAHLRARGVTGLVLAGVYTDVCVDSTARTAFQKGFHITVLADCTTSLHLSDAEILRFMGLVYGARITTRDDMSAWATAGEGSACPSPKKGSTPASAGPR